MSARKLPSPPAPCERATTTPGLAGATERKITTTNALGHQAVQVLDAPFESPISQTAANGLTTRWRYDRFGRKTLEQRPDGTGTRWVYGFCGDNGVACPAAGTATLSYHLSQYEVTAADVAADTGTKSGPYGRTYHDRFTRVVVEESEGWDGAGAARAIRQMTSYDWRGRLDQKTRPYFADQAVPAASKALYDFDILGRVTYESRFDGGVTQTYHEGVQTRRVVSAVSAVTTYTTELAHTTTETRDVLGQVVSIKDTLGKVLTRTYTPWGDLASSVDAAGNTTRVEYDLRGRKRKLIDPDLGTWIYEYNALGQLVKQTDALNKSSQFEYDLLGRQTRRLEPDHDSRWVYDSKYADGSACAEGRLCEASTPMALAAGTRMTRWAAAWPSGPFFRTR